TNLVTAIISLHATLKLLWCLLLPRRVAAQKENFRRLMRTVETLSDLGPELTAEREFAQTAQTMLSALIQAAGASEGVLFVFIEKPSMLNSIATSGFALIP